MDTTDDNLPVLADENTRSSKPTIPGCDDVVTAWLEGRNPKTLAAYAGDLEDFARFLGARNGEAAVELLLAGGAGQANRIGLGYKAHLTTRQLAAATIARRLAALRSMVKVARQIGRITWALDVEGPRAEPYRDTRGPGLDGWRKVVTAIQARAATGEWTATRDIAIVRLCHDLGLRRGEVVALDLDDVDLGNNPGTVAIVGKGMSAKTRLTLNLPARLALIAWIAARGDDPGPLFVRLDRAAEGPVHLPNDVYYHTCRLTGRAIAYMVARWAKRAGVARVVRPHGLRHQGITRALDLSGGDVRKVQRFSRHAKLETLMRYDDARRDDAGDIARQLGEDAQ